MAVRDSQEDERQNQQLRRDKSRGPNKGKGQGSRQRQHQSGDIRELQDMLKTHNAPQQDLPPPREAVISRAAQVFLGQANDVIANKAPQVPVREELKPAQQIPKLDVSNIFVKEGAEDVHLTVSLGAPIADENPQPQPVSQLKEEVIMKQPQAAQQAAPQQRRRALSIGAPVAPTEPLGRVAGIPTLDPEVDKTMAGLRHITKPLNKKPFVMDDCWMTSEEFAALNNSDKFMQQNRATNHLAAAVEVLGDKSNDVSAELRELRLKVALLESAPKSVTLKREQRPEKSLTREIGETLAYGAAISAGAVVGTMAIVYAVNAIFGDPDAPVM